MQRMKKFLFTGLSVLTVGLCAFGAVACDSEKEQGDTPETGTVWSMETVYAKAQELGYTGTLEEFRATVKGDKGEDGATVVSVSVNAQKELVFVLSDGRELKCALPEDIISSTPCVHTDFSDWETIEDADCYCIGVKSRVCEDCGFVEYDFQKRVHDFSEWEAESYTCGQSKTEKRTCEECGKTEKQTVAFTHLYEEGVCSLCGDLQTKGLAFQEYYDNTYGEIVCKLVGLGDCTDTEIYVPKIYQGFPVISVASEVFYGKTEITYVEYPSTVKVEGATVHATGFYNDEKNWENGGLYCGKHLVAVQEDYQGEFTIKEGTLTIADLAFYNCAEITTVKMPDSLLSIGANGNVFVECAKLESIDVPKSVNFIGSSITNCPNVASINVADENQAYQSIDGVLYTKDGSELLLYPTGKKTATFSIPNGVTKISMNSFKFPTCLTGVVVPATLETVLVGVFSNCPNLTNFSVSAENARYQSIDGNLYSKDGALMAYAIGKTDTSFLLPSTVKRIISYAFRNACYLEGITISENVTEIGGQAFANCENLRSLIFENKTGWVLKRGDVTQEEISAELLEDSVNALTYWKEHYNYTWARIEE